MCHLLFYINLSSQPEFPDWLLILMYFFFHRGTDRKEKSHPARGRHRRGETRRDPSRDRQIQGNHEGQYMKTRAMFAQKHVILYAVHTPF